MVYPKQHSIKPATTRIVEAEEQVSTYSLFRSNDFKELASVLPPELGEKFMEAIKSKEPTFSSFSKEELALIDIEKYQKVLSKINKRIENEQKEKLKFDKVRDELIEEFQNRG